MNIFKTCIGGMAMLTMSLCFVACSDDDEPSYSQSTVTNSELRNILTQKGYQFNEQGNLLLDDKANQDSLDLSGTNISVDALAELTIFPNLKTVNLSNNGYGPKFDLTKIPAQISGLDLRGNEIYDFDGLVSVNVVNDERQTTVLHNLQKLYLPESAKYNVEDLMPYYEKAGATTDMEMVNASGKLEKYNTLREIPDEYFRAYLKTTFSSIFVSDTQIDISKPLSNAEQGGNLMMNAMELYPDADKIKSIEGTEYFINNPYYKPFIVAVNCINKCSLEYVMPRSNIKAIVLYNVDTTDSIDFSEATNLSTLTLSSNNGIEKIDLTNTAMANQDYEDFDVLAVNGLELGSCPNLTEVKWNPSGIGITSDMVFTDLPKLKKLDLSSLIGIQSLTLQSLPSCEITYPMNLKYRYHTAKGRLYEIPLKRYRIEVNLSSAIKELESTKAFIEKFKSSLNVSVVDL